MTYSNDVQRSKATSSTKHEGLDHKKSSPYSLPAHIASFFICCTKYNEIQTNSSNINKNLQPVNDTNIEYDKSVGMDDVIDLIPMN